MKFLLAALTIFLAMPAFCGDAVRIGTTMAPPLSVPEGTGMLDRLVKDAFARTGTPLILVTLPSERGLISAAAGDTDGDINRVAGLSAKYPELVQVQEPNMVYEFMAFTLRQGPPVRTWQDLRDLNVAFITGWKIFEENVKAKNIVKVDNADQLFTLLSLNRVDAVLFDRWGGSHYLQKLGLNDAVAQEPPLATRDMFLYLNRRFEHLAPLLAGALRDMKADGSYDAIFGTPRKHPDTP